jgi:hypothetical protein
MVKSVIDLQGKNVAAAHTHVAALHEMIMPRNLAIATDDVDARSHCRPLAAHHQTDTGVGKVERIQDTTLAAAHSMVARHVNTPQHVGEDGHHLLREKSLGLSLIHSRIWWGHYLLSMVSTAIRERFALGVGAPIRPT